MPLKANFFAWTTSPGNILIIDNLWKHRMIVVDKCCMCRKNCEIMDHLLLPCEVVRSLWNDVFRRLELIGIMPAMAVEFG